jgi:hypothetical protein
LVMNSPISLSHLSRIYSRGGSVCSSKRQASPTSSLHAGACVGSVSRQMELGGSRGAGNGKTPPRGPDGTVQVRHRHPKGIIIARWHKHTWEPSRHKRLGWKHPTPHSCFSHLAHCPVRVPPQGSTPVASSGPLTRKCGRGSGSHLMRAFAGSKPLHRSRPLLPLHTLYGPLS